MFKLDLETIDRLRTEASNVLEPHVSGLEKLGRYAAQLRWITGKFPIDVRLSKEEKKLLEMVDDLDGKLMCGRCR